MILRASFQSGVTKKFYGRVSLLFFRGGGGEIELTNTVIKKNQNEQKKNKNKQCTQNKQETKTKK